MQVGIALCVHKVHFAQGTATFTFGTKHSHTYIWHKTQSYLHLAQGTVTLTFGIKHSHTYRHLAQGTATRTFGIRHSHTYIWHKAQAYLHLTQGTVTPNSQTIGFRYCFMCMYITVIPNKVSLLALLIYDICRLFCLLLIRSSAMCDIPGHRCNLKYNVSPHSEL